MIKILTKKFNEESKKLENVAKDLFDRLLDVNNYIENENEYNNLIEEFDFFVENYKINYTGQHILYYKDLEQEKKNFENSDHSKLISILMQNKKIKKKINKEINYEKIIKLNICKKNNKETIFKKNSLLCECKYSFFSPVLHKFEDLKKSIETLLEPLFISLEKEDDKEFEFLKNGNKISNFFNYLQKSDEIEEILEKIERLLENKELITINVNEIFNSNELKGKYKKINDIIKKINSIQKEKEDEIKLKHQKEIDIIFEYEII